MFFEISQITDPSERLGHRSPLQKVGVYQCFFVFLLVFFLQFFNCFGYITHPTPQHCSCVRPSCPQIDQSPSSNGRKGTRACAQIEWQVQGTVNLITYKKICAAFLSPSPPTLRGRWGSNGNSAPLVLYICENNEWLGANRHFEKDKKRLYFGLPEIGGESLHDIFFSSNHGTNVSTWTSPLLRLCTYSVVCKLKTFLFLYLLFFLSLNLLECSCTHTVLNTEVKTHW